MPTKSLNILLILSSLIVYLEWGADQQVFLYAGELELLQKLRSQPNAVWHPLIVIPLLGQLLLLITLFQKRPDWLLSFAGTLGISSLVFVIFIVGLISLRAKVALSCLPFLVLSSLALLRLYRAKVEYH